jgi:subtilisin family serine protease
VQTEGLHDVIQSHLDRGVLTVAAIGNGGAQGARCPGNFDIVLGVGAVDKAGAACNFSAWGKVPNLTPAVWKPDIMAPGEGVVCAKPKGTSSGNCYVSDSGTSFASPMVTGSAALLMEMTPILKGDVKALRARLLALTGNSANSMQAGTTSRRTAGTLDLGMI